MVLLPIAEPLQLECAQTFGQKGAEKCDDLEDLHDTGELVASAPMHLGLNGAVCSMDLELSQAAKVVAATTFQASRCRSHQVFLNRIASLLVFRSLPTLHV